MGKTESIRLFDHLMDVVLNLTQGPSLSSTPDAKRSFQAVLEKFHFSPTQSAMISE